MRLHFSLPVELNNHFNVPVDHTTWLPKTHHRSTHGWTPTRPRATFETWQRGLTEQTNFSRELRSMFGLYILLFSYPYPAIYIGIAASDVRSPEGISNRIKKHRVKATGSHVGSSPDDTGGVTHPKRWRQFAIDRSYFHTANESTDSLADVKLITARLQVVPGEAASSGQIKTELERFEKSIIADHRSIRSAIEKRFWPDFDGKVFVLNQSQGKPLLDDSDEIILWDPI